MRRDFDRVYLSQRGAVAVITLNHPEVVNAISPKMVRGLLDAIAFVNQLRPDDRVMVVSFDDKIHVWTQPTNDRAALRNAILRTRIGSGTKLYEAVDHVIHQDLSRIEGRKAIVLFTDGVDTTSKHATYESTVRDAEEFDALIYPVEYNTYGDMGGNSWPGSGGSRRGGGGGWGGGGGSSWGGGGSGGGDGGGGGFGGFGGGGDFGGGGASDSW